jgi:transposase
MPAIHGGTAKNDPIDSQTMAALLRGGMLPQAYVSPAQRRATRERLRRRPHLRRKRAELCAPVPTTNSQYNLPKSGKKIAYTANREGVAERFDDPAVHKTRAIALELIPYDDQMLSDLDRFLLTTAKQHEAQPLSLLQTVPGIGKILRLGLLYDMPQIDRFPRGQAFASYCRLIQCAKEAGGNRLGTSGNTIGNAHRQWAFAEAAPLFLRGSEPGQKYRAKLANKHDQGKARRLLAHKLARAVYVMCKRTTAFDLEQFLRTYGSRAGAPGAERDTAGIRRHRTDVQPSRAASLNAKVRLGPIIPAPRALIGHSLWLLSRRRGTASGVWGLPLPRA